MQEPLADFGDGYRIERELGGGGMSRVFLATDPTLGRQVVVKLLSRELAQELSVERFAREIRLAAALQDPHIVPVLSAGTTSDGLPYYTMPYVEGESLRARVAKGPVPLDDALRVLRDVAEALEYAHAHGVVHRDIKPENILLAGRNAVVADFGIAKAVSAARTEAPGGTLTQVGASIGTPAYMAPEQAAGDPTDHRADLYAWGVVAWELLAGAHPFAHKNTTQGLIAAHIAETPKAIGEARPGLPPGLAALVTRCLAKSPADRPADAGEVLGALANLGTSGAFAPASIPPRRSRRMLLVGGAATALVAAVAAGVMSMRDGAPATAVRTNSLAVLPFEHQGDSSDVYLTEGITDEIRGKLTGVRDLAVTARTSSNSYRGTRKTPQEIARELGVRYLLTGTVQVVGTGESRQVLVRPELVEITEEGRLEGRWQQPFEAPASDVIRVQANIAAKVVSGMEMAVGGADRARLVQVATRDPVAYDLYLRGRAATNWGASNDPASLRAAIPLLEQAVARDSAMLDAWSALVGNRAVLYATGMPTKKLAEETRVAAERARALDPNGAFGHRAMHGYYRLVLRDMPRALQEAEAAVRVAPNDASMVHNLALLYDEIGRGEEALRMTEQGVQLDPRNAGRKIALAAMQYARGHLAESRRAYAEAASLAPASLTVIASRIEVELAVGDTAAARRIMADGALHVPRARLLPQVAMYSSSWFLDSVTRQEVLTLPPAAYGDDHGTWALVRARIAWWNGDSTSRRRWGDSAARYFRAQLAEVPSNSLLIGDLAEALGHAGRNADALREAGRSLAIVREQAGAAGRVYAGALANAIFAALASEQRDSAMAWLSEFQKRRPIYTPAHFRLNPSFAPLHGDPRFEAMLAESK